MPTSKRSRNFVSSSQTSDNPPVVRTGTPVKVRGGPFSGHTGLIEQRNADRLALVRIEVLGRPVRLEIEPYYLDVLN